MYPYSFENQGSICRPTEVAAGIGVGQNGLAYNGINLSPDKCRLLVADTKVRSSHVIWVAATPVALLDWLADLNNQKIVTPHRHNTANSSSTSLRYCHRPTTTRARAATG